MLPWPELTETQQTALVETFGIPKAVAFAAEVRQRGWVRNCGDVVDAVGLSRWYVIRHFFDTLSDLVLVRAPASSAWDDAATAYLQDPHGFMALLTPDDNTPLCSP